MMRPTEYISLELQVSQKGGKVLWGLTKRYFPLVSRAPEYETKTKVLCLMAHIVALCKLIPI